MSTSLMGYINATYDELVNAFGEPQFGPNESGRKTTCEWCLKFNDDTIATIYDWKTEFTPQEEYEWHIGGHTENAVSVVKEVFLFHNDFDDELRLRVINA